MILGSGYLWWAGVEKNFAFTGFMGHVALAVNANYRDSNEK